MSPRLVLLLALAAPLPACTTDATADPGDPAHTGGGGKADDPVDQADVPPELAALAARLTRNGLLGQPPVADQYGADFRQVQVSLVNVEAGLGAHVDERSNTMLAHLGEESSGLARLLDAPDVHVALASGWEQEEIKAFLLARIASTRNRDQVRRLLDAIHGDYLHLEAYDVGSEIIGEDILVIRPLGAKVAVEIHWTYTQT